MADIHELQLTLRLPGPLPPEDLALLRRHVGLKGGRRDADNENPPVGSPGRDTAGGAPVGELRSTGDAGRAPTVRQETHPDAFEDLRRTVLWFGARKRTLGTVGYLRFPEPHLPDMLIADIGAVRREVLRVDKAVGAADQVIPDVHALNGGPAPGLLLGPRRPVPHPLT